MRHAEIKEDCVRCGCVGEYENPERAGQERCSLSGAECAPKSCVIKDYFLKGNMGKRINFLKHYGLEKEYAEEMGEG